MIEQSLNTCRNEAARLAFEWIIGHHGPVIQAARQDVALMAAIGLYLEDTRRYQDLHNFMTGVMIAAVEQAPAE